MKPKAIVFDAYGTLFDVNSAAEKCKNKLGNKWESFANYWRTTQLEYTWLRSLMKKHKNLYVITFMERRKDFVNNGFMHSRELLPALNRRFMNYFNTFIDNRKDTVYLFERR